MRTPRLHSRSLLLAIGMLAVAGCNDATSPRYEPEITNVANSFQFQVTDLVRVSDALEYRWQNDGTTATINQSTVLSAGTATLTLRDAAGTQVYSRSLTENGTFTSTAGTAGQWRIRIAFANASGTANFRVQRTTPR
jgi:hypothetical protein